MSDQDSDGVAIDGNLLSEAIRLVVEEMLLMGITADTKVSNVVERTRLRQKNWSSQSEDGAQAE